MASDKQYLEYVLAQCPDGTSYRAMMGEYILYYKGSVFGGIYDNRMLVKPTPSAIRLLPDSLRELPYGGAKEMLLLDRLDDRDFMKALLEQMYTELPLSKKRKQLESFAFVNVGDIPTEEVKDTDGTAPAEN